MNKYMKEAINEAYKGIKLNHGGPFGCVIVKHGQIIGRGHNKVLKDEDATEHGEMVAIKDANKTLKSHNLRGCTLYTTGEPCNMCLCASLWANVRKIYYGCTIKDNALIGFRDNEFDKIFGGRRKLKNKLKQIDRDECLKLFNDYANMHRETY